MSDDDAKRAAENVLAEFWSDRGIPVDPYEVADAMGVIVKFVQTENKVAGGIWKEESGPPIIFIAEDDHSNRKRFTCAHELGHYYEHLEESKYEYLDYRSDMSSQGISPSEIFANQFAGNLLMPEDEIRSKYVEYSKKYTDERSIILVLSRDFDLSVEAITVRLKVLGLAKK